VSAAEAKGVIMKTERYLVDSASPEHLSKNAEKISTLILLFLFFGRVHGMDFVLVVRTSAAFAVALAILG
jgi:hypothetical protein